MQRTMLAFLVVTLLAMGLMAGCGNNEGQADMPGGFYEIKGSDSEVNLVQALVEAYYDIDSNVEFSVSGGGSGTGIAALIGDETSIANSSRAMKDSEIADARNGGIEPVPIVFSMDGLAVILHENNPVQRLTVKQIGKIYAGEITNWKDVGGEDKPISLYGRQSNSGTYVYFMERVVKGDYAVTMQNMNGNSQIVEGVRTDETAIGYVALGYLQGSSGIKALEVAETEAGPFISPADYEKVKAGEYVLTRPLYQYLNGTPSGALKQFIEFELSAQGQRIVEEQGFLPVSDEFMQENQKYLN